MTTTDEIDLLVHSPQAAAVSQASIAAGAANNSSARVGPLRLRQHARLLQSATSGPLFTEAQNDLANLSKLLSADPALALVRHPAPADHHRRECRQPRRHAVRARRALFNSITGVLNVEATEQFTVALTPIEADLDLGQGETFSVQLTDTGNDPETLNLSAGTLPSGVSVALARTPCRSPPNQSISVPVTLSQTLQSATYFELDVTAAATVAQHTDSAMIAVRPSVADVLSVTVSPSAINAGDPVSVSAQVFNTANVAERAGADRDPRRSGNVVGTPTDVPVSLVPGNGDLTLNLGQVSTTGLANGLYSVNVSLVDRQRHAAAGPVVASRLRDRPAGHGLGCRQRGVRAARDIDRHDDDHDERSTRRLPVSQWATSRWSMTPNNFMFNGKPLGSLDAPAFVIQNTSSTRHHRRRPEHRPGRRFDAGLVRCGHKCGRRLCGHRSGSLERRADPSSGGFFGTRVRQLDTSDAGPTANNVQFEFTGMQNGVTIDSGIFTPAATYGPSEDDNDAHQLPRRAG